ncbi:MAG: EamA family transporter [Patescibacteria group bacterium]|nr:EamA family transporter [Patescibacteria group bacterium]
MNNWFILSLVSAIGFGIIPLFLKTIQQKVPPQLAMAWYYSIVAIILWVVSLLTTKITIPDIKNSSLLIIVSILAAIADLSIFYAYKLTSNVGYARSVQAFSIVIALILSSVLYRQFPNIIGVIGTIIIFLGVVMLSGVK